MVKGKSLSLDGVYKFIANYELKYNIKFGSAEGLTLGSIDPRAKPHKLVWCERKATTNVNHIRRYAARGITPFDGVPYLFLGETFRRCIYGVYRYIKHFHNKRHAMVKTSNRFRCRSGLFCGCPGIVVIREVYKFSDMKIPKNCPKLRLARGRQFAQKWADNEIEGQRWFYFFISPLREHENHEVPGAGGCTVEPFSEDKIVTIDEHGEVVGFEIHDPDNPSADIEKDNDKLELPELASKRARLDSSVKLPTGKSQVLSDGATSASGAPTLSYEDSLLNHESKLTSTPINAVSTNVIPSSSPLINTLTYRPIQPKNAQTSIRTSVLGPTTMLPVTVPVSAPRISPTQAITVAPARVVKLKRDSPNCVHVLNTSTGNQLKQELSQFQKRTDSRLSAVEQRMSSIETRMASLESVILQVSSQLRTVQSLLESSHNARTIPSTAPRNSSSSSRLRRSGNVATESVIPSELDFECTSHVDIHLEPFSPNSICDDSPK